MKFKRNMVLALSTVMILASLVGCTTKAAAVSTVNASDIVATYTQGSLEQGAFYEGLLSKAGMMTMLDMVDKGILDTVTPITDEMTTNVEANVTNIKSYYTEGFEESLKINGFKDENDFRNSLYLNEQRNTYALEYIISNNITDEEINAYYEEFSPKIEASHILIKPVDETEGAIAAAKAKAVDLTARINAGEDFAVLAKEFSEDPGSGANGGALGPFGKGMMVPEFETAAFALGIDEVTAEPVQSQFGFHIIKKTADEGKKPLEEMKADIQNTLAAQKLQADQSLTYKALVQLREENGFKISNPVIADQYKIFEEQVKK